MVRLVGFVVLVGLVVLVLQVVSQRRPEPEPITSTAAEPEFDVQVRPHVNISAAYGAVALRAQDAALAQHLRRALNAGLLLGHEADHELWYLFPRREAAHIGNKVVQVFECHLRARGLRGEAADRFRAQAKLRGAVLALGRANGGRLGVFLPRYFRIEGERVPVAAPCRVLDDESRPGGFASANPPGVP